MLDSSVVATVVAAVAHIAAARVAVAKEDEPELRRVVAGLSAWLSATLLISRRAETTERWSAHVATVRDAATQNDWRRTHQLCSEWGGSGLESYVRSTAEFTSYLSKAAGRADRRPVELLRFERPYRGEQVALVAIAHHGDRDGVGGVLKLADGEFTVESMLEALRAVENLDDYVELTPPEQGETEERVVALLTGFLANMDFDVLSKVDPSECETIGANASRDALAAVRWSQVVGDRLDTGEVAELLRVTRQALAQRVAAGTMLGIPGRRTTYYPVWQFDMSEKRVRDETVLILGEFRNKFGPSVDPYVVASWMRSPQADLEGLSPVEWLYQARPRTKLIGAARRAAAQAAS